MNRFKIFVAVGIFLVFNACASNPGGSVGNEGIASLALKLIDPEEGEAFHSADDFEITFHHFAVAFEGISLGKFQTLEPFAADFGEAEATEVIDLQQVPGISYDEMSLTFGLQAELPDEEEEAEAEEGEEHEHEGELPHDLGGRTIFIEAEAVRGEEACVVQIALSGQGLPIEVNTNDQEIVIEADQEQEVLVEVDPSELLGRLSLAGSCLEGATLLFTEESDPALALNLLEDLKNAFSFVPMEAAAGEEGEHGHAH